MAKDYVEERNGGYYVANCRVSLNSVVYAYLRGETPMLPIAMTWIGVSARDVPNLRVSANSGG